jgi:type IV pilus assembly protein PilA
MNIKTKTILSKNSQSGFSLVELMIVVAIIGILSSIAVPQFQRFIFKARQTEAKTGLSSLYSAEKAFYGEYSEFDANFPNIGYLPEGKYYYNIGFSEAHCESSNMTTGHVTGGRTQTCGASANTTYPNCLSNSLVAITKSSCNRVSTFTAEAVSENIGGSYGSNHGDSWTINQDKNLTGS